MKQPVLPSNAFRICTLLTAHRPAFLLEDMAGGQRHICMGPMDGYHLGLEQPEETRMFTGAGQIYNQLGK